MWVPDLWIYRYVRECSPGPTSTHTRTKRDEKKGSTPHIGTNDTSKGIDAHNFRSRSSVKEEFFLIYQRSVPNDLMKMRKKFGQLLKDICIAGWVGDLIICCLVNKHHYTLDSSRSNVIFFGEKKGHRSANFTGARKGKCKGN